MNLPEALGKEVRAELAAQSMSLSQLARLTKISRSTLYNYVDARRPFPLAGIVHVAAVLQVAPSELLRRAESRARAEAAPGIYGAMTAVHRASGRAAARLQPDAPLPWAVPGDDGETVWRSDKYMSTHGWEAR